MEIDIITYTDEQFARLTEEQILEVRSAQLKKNRLERELQEKLQKEKYRLAENGTVVSGIWELVEKQLTAEYEEEVAWIRDSLLFYLRFSVKTLDGVDAPYPIDYSLTTDERARVVKEYYLSTYTNATERFEKYKDDETAKIYLCERYKNLYEYFLYLSNL